MNQTIYIGEQINQEPLRVFTQLSVGLRIEMRPDTLHFSLDLNQAGGYAANEDENEFDVMAREINFGSDLIQQDAQVWEQFGFLAIDAGRRRFVIAPTSAALNRKRTPRLIEKTGIHSGTFVDYPAHGTQVPVLEFAKNLAERKIPVSLDTHDSIVHNSCIAVLCEQIFERFSVASRMSLEAGTDDITIAIIRAFDGLTAGTGLLGTNNPQIDYEFLAEIYSYFMHPLAAGVFAASDMTAQRHTAAALLDTMRQT